MIEVCIVTPSDLLGSISAVKPDVISILVRGLDLGVSVEQLNFHDHAVLGPPETMFFVASPMGKRRYRELL